MAKTGRPSHQPTDLTRNVVKVGLTCGLEFQQIAAQLGIDRKSLRKHYNLELETGKDDIHIRVAGNLIQTSLTKSKEAVAAGKFILERRFGWNAPRSQHEIMGPEGGPIQTAEVTDEARARALAAFLAKTAAKK